MKRMRQVISICLAATMAASCLAGCGGKKGNKGGTSKTDIEIAYWNSGYGSEWLDEMVEAFKKGYAEAEKKWGGKLPDICQRTYDTFIKKMDEWKNSSEEE